tara:strand:+ start:722 stop:1036 length:315 start_codon:yes stop_codon:yes gene_type:complete
MKTEFKYELRKHGKYFTIYEVKTKMYVAQGSDRKAVAAICSNMNNGGFFNGETPSFFLRSGPIEINEKVYTRKSTQNKSKQKTRNRRARHYNKRRQEEHVLPLG